MNILITGGAGYIGTALTQSCLFHGLRVTALDNLFYGQSPTCLSSFLLNPKYTFKRQDCLDVESYADLIQEADVIYHLAALVGFPVCEQHQALAYELHVETTRRILDYRRKGTKFIFPTSNSGYGSTTGTDLCTESTELNPISWYGKTKAAAEKICWDYEDVVTLRLATVFGPSFRIRRDLLVNNFVYRAWKEKVNVIFDPKAMRNYINLQDLVWIMHTLAMNNNLWEKTQAFDPPVFNVGDDRLNMSKLQLAEKINEVVPHEILLHEFGKDPDKRNYIVSNQRLYSLSKDLIPIRNLEATIRQLVKFYEAYDEPIYGNY